MGVLDKLFFWRQDDDEAETGDFSVDGCFTLPGAEIPLDACEAPEQTELPNQES